MKLSVLFFLVQLVPVLSNAQKADTLKYCLSGRTIGVGGYDVVSYFQLNQAQVGSPTINVEYDKVEYRFVSAANKKEFQKNPSKYIPQYGGWCSMTLAMGRATKPKYDNFLVSGGKLFLFERTLSVNGKELWLRDPNGNAALAEKTYQSYIRSSKTR